MTGPGLSSELLSEAVTGEAVTRAGVATDPPRLKKRADFLRAAKGSRWHAQAFSLQAARREETGPARVGLTVTRKAGTAVERNRMRRRLREALRLGAGLAAQHDHDYVIVARRDLLKAPFAELQSELEQAFNKVRRPRKARPTTVSPTES